MLLTQGHTSQVQGRDSSRTWIFTHSTNVDVSGTVLGIGDRVMNEIKSPLSWSLNSSGKDEQEQGKVKNNMVLSSDKCYEQNKKLNRKWSGESIGRLGEILCRVYTSAEI